MPPQMQLVVTLRKDVPDQETGEAIFDLVRQRLADRPDIQITGHVTNHFPEPPPPQP